MAERLVFIRPPAESVLQTSMSVVDIALVNEYALKDSSSLTLNTLSTPRVKPGNRGGGEAVDGGVMDRERRVNGEQEGESKRSADLLSALNTVESPFLPGERIAVRVTVTDR